MIAQALHIFRKDLRYLRIPLAVFLLITVLFAFAQISPLSSAVVVLVALAAGLVIARLVHAETIAGTSQYWLTRPYNWKSLLLAKLLYLAVCLDIPIGLARFAGLIAQHYPVVQSLLPLLWAQVLLFGILAATAALTSLTAGIVELILTLLAGSLVAAIVIIGSMRAIPRFGPWPNSISWVSLTICGALAAAITAATLLWQYRDHRTQFSRTFVIVSAVVVELMSFAIPVTAGLALQSLFSKEPSPNFQIALGKSTTGLQWNRARDVLGLPLSIRLVGLPPDTEIRPDLTSLTIAWSGGEIAHGPANLIGASERNGVVTLNGLFQMPRGTLDRFRMTPAALHLSMYLTLFGSPESHTIPFDAKPRNVAAGLQCYTGLRSEVFDNDFAEYRCRNFFGWPSRLVSVKADGDVEDFTKIVSYAPFSSGPALDSNESSYVTIPWSKDGKPPSQVTVTAKRPLVHFEREFDVPNIRLNDLISK